MITINRDGARLTLTIEHGLPVQPAALLLTWDAGNEILAAALVTCIGDQLAGRIEGIRRAEYEAGWKAARARTASERARLRRGWFFRDLRPGDGR